jgi:Lysyl oxidase
MSRARALFAVLVGVPLLAVSVAATWRYWPRDLPPLLASPRRPVLPDLAMPALKELLTGVDQPGNQQRLFFTASIANIGRGPFVVHAVRADRRGGWRVTQRFREHDGSTTELETELETPGELVWGGHGHNHWHVHLGAAYELLDKSGEVVRKYEKVGYCFFDQARMSGSTTRDPPRFRKNTCEGAEQLEREMGLSPGWQDPYQWTLPDQRLEITGLKDGTYRLVARADPDNWFRESDESNNETWVDVRLTTSTSPPRVKLLRVRPHA